MKLPIEKQPKDSSPFIVINICIPLIILFGLNIYVYFLFSAQNPNRGYEIIKHKWELISKAKNKINWAIFGDSSGNQGLDCSSLSTEENNLNLCTIGNLMLLDDVWMLQSLVEKDCIPDKVLLVHVFDVWQREEVPEGAFHQLPKMPEDIKPKPKYNYNSYAHYLPLYYQSRSVLKTFTSLEFLKNKVKYNFNQCGTMIMENNNESLILKDYEKTLKDLDKMKEFEISNNNIAALEVLATLSKQHDIKVYIAHSPLFEKVVKNEKFIELNKKIVVKMRSLESKYNFTFINENPLGLSLSDMENGIDHVNKNGSSVYTSHIKKEIKNKVLR